MTPSPAVPPVLPPPPPAPPLPRRGASRAATIVVAILALASGAVLLASNAGSERADEKDAGKTAPAATAQAPPSVGASDRIERSYALDPAGRFSLALDSGDVRVTVGSGEGARVVASLADGVAASEVEWREVETGPGEVRLEIKGRRKGDAGFLGGLVKRGRTRSGVKEVRVELPAGASVSLDTGFGDVSVAGVAGGSIRSGAGDVDVAGVTAEIEIATGAGEVDVVSSSDVKVESGAGDVEVNAQGEVELTTGAGSVRLRGAPRRATVHSGAGDVDLDLDGIPGPVVARTGIGSVSLEAGAAVGFVLHAASGIGGVSLHASSGSRSTKAMGGRLTATIGAGGPSVELETGAGSVAITTPEPAT